MKKREQTKKEFEKLNKNLPKMELKKCDQHRKHLTAAQNKKTTNFHDIKLIMDKIDEYYLKIQILIKYVHTILTLGI